MMSEKGLVSTIIPVFNRPSLVVEAIESVLSQTYRPIEIIIVDDGSTDNTLDVLYSLEKIHPEINVFSQANAGPGVARELGRQNARGEFIQYLDSDDLLLPEKFRLQVAALNEQPDCSVVYGKTESTLIGEPLKGLAMRKTGTKYVSMFPEFLRDRWWGTSTPLYRTSVLNTAGPWMDTLNEEDWEYDCRVASLGGKLAYVDEFVSHARRHDDHLSDQGSTDPAKLKHRCLAQHQIYQHARNYMSLDGRLTDINSEDWFFFSKAVFLLARQCASVGLTNQASSLIKLSIKVNGCATMKHYVFYFLTAMIGWRNTSKFFEWVGK